MYTHTKFDHQFEDSPPAIASFVVASTPRCGSSLLCEALCMTGKAGAPTEFFDEETKQGFLKRWNQEDAESYLETLLRKKTSLNGVFGFKTHWHQYHSAFGDTLPASLPNLKFIFIRRRNRVRQAVSYWKAIQTNQWAATHRATNDSPQYDFVEINKLLTRIRREESAWNQFFKRNELEPLELIYEEFSVDLDSAIRNCLSHFDISVSDNWKLPELTLKKQADETSDEWVARFLADRR